MSELNVRNIEKEEFDEWATLVERSPQGTIFHKSYWLEASLMKYRIYGCYRGSELVGGLPITYSEHLGIKCACHPPLTPYIGAIYENLKGKNVTRLSKQKEICTKLAKKLKEDFDGVSFRFAPFSVDLQPFIWEGFSTSVSYVYRLSIENLDSVWKEMDKRRREYIAHSEREGFYTVLQDDLEELYSLVEKTYQKQQMKPFFRKAAFSYQSILKTKNECKSFVVKDRSGKSKAAVFIVWDRNTAYSLLSGYDYESDSMDAGSLAMWEAIKFSRNQLNLKEFDFCGSMIPRIERYLRKFGGTLTPTYSVDWSKFGIKWLVRAYRITSGLSSKLIH